jgi:hypothetical protein
LFSYVCNAQQPVEFPYRFLDTLYNALPVSQITISRLFQNGSGSEQAHPSSALVTSSPAKEKQTSEYFLKQFRMLRSKLI